MVYHHGVGIKHVHLHRCDPGGVPAGAADYDGWPVHRRRSWRALQGGAHWQERQLQLCSFHTHIKARCKGQRRLEVEVALDEVYPPLGVSFNEIPLRIIWRMTWSYDSWQASLCCSSLKFMYLSCFFDQNWLSPLLQPLNPYFLSSFAHKWFPHCWVFETVNVFKTKWCWMSYAENKVKHSIFFVYWFICYLCIT